jgi:hypothetical protein
MGPKTGSIELRASAPETEYDVTFLQGMIDRMAVSFHKYGAVADGYPDRVDAMASLKMRLDSYTETGNTEFLMDVANFAMIEFMRPRHPEAHFRPTDSDESPGRMTTSGNLNRRDKNTRLLSKP